jgi:uncharacterized protein (TIGR02246 family)
VTVREADVETLYLTLLGHWNERDAAGMAALCVPHAYMIGFDGSELDGREAIEAELRKIFAHHETPSYVAKVRSVELFEDVAILRAVVGMIPHGAADLNPELNAIQTFIASREPGRWRVEALQSTPAAFHGRPEARERLTAELREVLRLPRPQAR